MTRSVLRGRAPRADLLPDERRHRPPRIAVVAPAAVQPDLAVVAKEVQARHVRPRIAAGNRDLVARDPRVGHLVAVHALDPLEVERGGGEDAGVGRGLRGADVAGLLVALRAQVDDLPAEADLVLDALVEAETLGAGLVVAVPAPVRLLLRLRPRPQLVERALEAARDRLLVLVRLVGEVGDEHDGDELLLGPGRDGLLRRGEGLVGDAPAELLVPLAHAGDLLLGRGEEAVHEREARVAHERLVHELRQLVVVAGVHLADDLRREARTSEAALELRDLSVRVGRKAGHDGLPPLGAVRLVRVARIRGLKTCPWFENGMLRPTFWP